MNPVCKFIQFIKELTDDEFCYYLGYIPSTIYFKNGGCYELVKILKHFLPDSQIWVSNNYEHCITSYKGILYDIDGIVEDNTDYHLATKDDIDFLNDETMYGRPEIRFEYMKPSIALIQNILECRIECLIKECHQMSETPNYYVQKQKFKTSL